MARRNSYPGGRWGQRPGAAYARTSGWPTRYYGRKISGSIVSALAGINTTSDDFEKKEGESSYLWNVRLNGTKEARKRAQSMSRMGQEFYAIPPEAEKVISVEQGDVNVVVSEEKSVRWAISVPQSKLTSVGLRFDFDEYPDNTHAHFVLILRDKKMKELCRAVRSVADLYKANENSPTGIQWFRMIHTVEEGGYLEASLVDDLDNRGNPTGLELRINATGSDNHLYAEHTLPNLDEALREKKYEWQKGINIPVTSYKTCSWKPFRVWLQRGYFTAGNNRYSIIGAINESGQKVIYKVKYANFDKSTGRIDIVENNPEVSVLIPADKLDQRASAIRMTQAGNELYYVDGYSNLRRVNLDNWNISDAVPDAQAVDTFGYAGGMYYYANSIIINGNSFWRCKEDHQGADTFDDGEKAHWEQKDMESLRAWPGASLIYFLNNRLILSGFREATVGATNPKAEPNLVIMSSITSVKPQYDMFNREIEFFYVPDMAPSQSSAAPVTAFAHVGDYLLCFTTDGLHIETIQSAVEFSGIAQTTPEGSQYGVMCQEHVCEGRNNVYFYNPNMGVMRTAGSTASVISGPVDSLMDGMTTTAQNNACLCMTDELVRFYYNPDGGPNSISLVDYATIPAHRSYWYRDQNTPVCCTYVDISSEMYMAIHSEYPCMMILDSTLKDFDCAILYEYYTKYLGTPDRLDKTIVRRIHVTTLQTYQSSIYIGLDYDHNNKPLVWRKFITPVEPGTFEAEDIFGDDDEAGATNLDIRVLTDNTRFVQIRLKQYCYDFQAEILQVGFEYANKTTL